MTDTGSLGPIDAQVMIGRSVVSAHNYKCWVMEKMEEAKKNGFLNPFDAQIIAQIPPGETINIFNSLEFAKDLVKKWLENYKFKNWIKRSKSGDAVTDEVRKARAAEVAEMFCDHNMWRSHGRSLKIEDFEDLLIIERIDNDRKFADIVYSIKTVIQFLFNSPIYKIYAHKLANIAQEIIVQTAQNQIIPLRNANPSQQNVPTNVELKIKCAKCGHESVLIGYTNIDNKVFKEKGYKPNVMLDDKNQLTCQSCKNVVDLTPTIRKVEKDLNVSLMFN